MTEFRSRWGVYLTRVQINGNTRNIRFAELRDGGSYYATSKWEEVEALKNHPGYDNDFTMFKEDPSVVPPVKQPKALTPEVANPEPKKMDVKQVPTLPTDPQPGPIDPGADVVESVVNISQAREYLKNKGVVIQKLRTPKSIMKYAGELNVEFPNLKEG